MTQYGVTPSEVLLKALDSIKAAQESADVEIKHVAVVWSGTKLNEEGSLFEASGYSTSADPHWLIAALLRSAAEEVEYLMDDVTPDFEEEIGDDD